MNEKELDPVESPHPQKGKKLQYLWRVLGKTSVSVSVYVITGGAVVT